MLQGSCLLLTAAQAKKTDLKLREQFGISTKAEVLSVDIPSGLNATTGESLGCSVIADRTVTFIAKKRGMVFGNGPKYCGKVVVSGFGYYEAKPLPFGLRLGISACKII